MKKQIISIASSCALATQLYAGGNIVQPVDIHVDVEKIVHEETHEESKFYVVVKGATIFGDNVEHGHDILDGDRGYGFGLDLGYRLGHGFALEYDFSYATNTVTETDEGGHHPHEVDAKYTTHAFDLVYTHHVTHHLGLFVKAGYEYEKEEIEDLHIDGSDNGFVYGIGLEYAVNEDYAFLVEYEASTIEGPRGPAVFVGVMYNF